MPRIIGISGKAGAGKDFLADAIIDEVPSFKKVAFADPLKEYAASMLNRPLEDMYTQEGKQKVNCLGITNRDFLQQLGVKMREIHPNFWVQMLHNKIRNMEDVIITDVRFANEFDAINKWGGLNVRIERLAPQTVWEKLTGITLSCSVYGDMSKTVFIEYAKNDEWHNLLNEGERKILKGLTHCSETDLDKHSFDFTVINIHGRNLKPEDVLQLI
jgi:hypothetical protein